MNPYADELIFSDVLFTFKKGDHMEADLIIKDVYVFNVYFKKFIYGDVSILNGRFLYIGKDCHEKISARNIIEGNKKYLIPGLIDIHMHIESSMTTPTNFANAVIKNGVTTVVADPHEIANVFGIEGIKAMINSDRQHIMDIFYGIPSSVPSTSAKLETTGGQIGIKEVSELIKNDRIWCIGEVMNFKDLVYSEDSLINNIIKLIKKEKPHFKIEGHCPKISGLDLARYIYQGVDADHTQQNPKSIEEKISNGMFLEIQEKSMTKENMEYLISNDLYEHFCFVTDDTMADKLITSHLNGLVKKAIEMGMKPEMAVYASTFIPARRMNFYDRGSIAPGKIADFILLDDLKSFSINEVYKNGELACKGVSEKKEHEFPNHFYKSIKMNPVRDSDFSVKAPVKEGKVKCRIMKVQSNSTFTKEESDFVEVKDWRLSFETSKYALITVFNRYDNTKKRSYGLVSGSVIERGAVASSYAHDHHNLMVMGKNAEDMKAAANWVIKNNGGYCAALNGKIIASLALPVGGILSEEPVESIALNLKKVRMALKKLGYKHNNEIMSFSTLSLPVSPELKITDKGLIRVNTQEIVSLFCE
ncbi:adenine deaminase C-terminal domain-containing protein [Clostridium sp. AWRP]|uniref:adenine deaminase C-terminal domain-containing protein n=1 Tax=Clostridium sp. AWRP TaxID=2212991 RepID=UPI001FAB1D5A|nr:adenine deaminase C-terminal domain-containing protein [Clostridium sp. AWRP]